MAQQDQLGPFSEYLTKPAAASMAPFPVPPVTGLEGTGAAIGNIAMNFINGLRQGRMQKYAMQEAEREKQFNAYQHAIKTVAASDLPDQQKQMLHAKLSLPLIQSIAGDKNATSKQTGNPLTDVVKNVATGIIGGNIPKKGQPLSMEPVVEALQMASDPSLSRTRLSSGYEATIRARGSQIQKENPYADANTFMNDPEIQATIQQAEEQIGPYDSPYLKAIRGEFKTPSYMERAQLKVLQEAGVLPRAQQGEPEVSPAVSTAPLPGTAPTVATTAAPPTERIGPVQLNPEALNRARAASTVPGFQSTYRLGPSTSEYEYDGKRVVVKPFQAMLEGKSVSGMLDESTNTLYPTGSLTKQLRPGQYSQEEVEDAYSAAIGPLKETLKGEDSKIAQDFFRRAEVARKTGDMATLKKLNESASDFIQDKWKAEQAELRAEKRVAAGDARRENAADEKRFEKQASALQQASTAYLQSKPYTTFSKMDTNYRVFVDEDLKNGINVEVYLSNPEKYMANIPPSQRQEHLSLMDKSLQRLAAKITDEGSVVRPMEEEGYGPQISGPAANLRAKISALIGTGSTKSTPAARAEVWRLIRGFHGQMKRVAEEEKQRRKATLSGWEIEPERVDRVFGDYTTIGGVGTEAAPSIPVRRLKKSGTTTPPSGGKPAGLEAFKHLNPETKVQ